MDWHGFHHGDVVVIGVWLLVTVVTGCLGFVAGHVHCAKTSRVGPVGRREGTVVNEEAIRIAAKAMHDDCCGVEGCRLEYSTFEWENAVKAVEALTTEGLLLPEPAEVEWRTVTEDGRYPVRCAKEVALGQSVEDPLLVAESRRCTPWQREP